MLEKLPSRPGYKQPALLEDFDKLAEQLRKVRPPAMRIFRIVDFYVFGRIDSRFDPSRRVCVCLTTGGFLRGVDPACDFPPVRALPHARKRERSDGFHFCRRDAMDFCLFYLWVAS